MLVLCARAAAAGGKNNHCGTARAGLVGALLATLMVAGCAALPLPQAASAADSEIAVPAARYSSVTAPYTPQRPVEPLPWLEQNRRVAPQARP